MIATLRILMLSAALTAVALPVSAPAAVPHVVPALSGGVHLSAGLGGWLMAFELGPWKQVLLDSLTPDYPSSAARTEPTVTRVHIDPSLVMPDFALPLLRVSDETAPALSFELFQFSTARISDQGNGATAASRPDQQRFEQSVVMPGLTRQLAGGSAVTVSAVLASQRFANANMNVLQQDGPLASADRLAMAEQGILHGPEEVAHGIGVRMAWVTRATERVELEAALQSRVDMTEFATVRGLHGSLAQLDIPSRMELGLRFHTSDRLAWNASVSRIFYGEIGAFPSRALPARFGALLGDGASPEFNWDDLTVLRLGWLWQPTHNTQVFMDYRTRTQPRPSAAALAQALESELANNSFTFGVVQDLSQWGFGRGTQFRVSAAYAPPEYAFGGNVMGVVSDRLSQSTEVQVLLKTDF
jgi:long-chain fatty acid transport protein